MAKRPKVFHWNVGTKLAACGRVSGSRFTTGELWFAYPGNEERVSCRDCLRRMGKKPAKAKGEDRS